MNHLQSSFLRLLNYKFTSIEISIAGHLGEWLNEENEAANIDKDIIAHIESRGKKKAFSLGSNFRRKNKK